MSFAKVLAMKRKILVADDDPGIRDIFKLIFEKAGYEIELKENGNDIIENNYNQPDLFLIDKQLPGIDGLAVCMHLKSQELTKNIPLIMISASPDISILSKKACADDYIEKPFDLKHLLKMVERYTSLNEKKSPVIKS